MTGAAVFLRTFLRRDRWHLLWWGLGVTLLFYSQAVSVKGLYTTQAEFDRAADAMESNPAFLAMAGPARALNTVGGQVMWQSAAFGCVLVGLMAMFLIGRHTRAEEESGREELVRAAPVGRFATVGAAVGTVLLAQVLVGALVALSLISYDLAAADSIAVGLGLTLCGWFFTGTALVAAQLTSSTRSMYGVAGAVIAVTYALRAVGDVGNPVFSWLSPIGWYQAMHPYSGVRWWPALLLVAATAAALSAAYAVFVRRDIGSGILAARPGPPRASAGLTAGPGDGLGLAWRLQRGSVLGWTAGLFLGGLAYGSIGDGPADIIGDSEVARDMFGGSGADLVDGFYGTAILMLAVIAGGFAISSALRPRGEEDATHAEVLLATALSRRGWLLGHTIVTVAGTIAVLVAGGLGLGLGYALVTGDAGALTRLSVPLLAYVAPVLVLSGLARLLYGFAPRVASLAWLLLGFAAVVMLFGEVFRMPAWVQDVSPFQNLARVPAEDFRILPVLVLLALAAALSAAAQFGLSRRDMK
jgi:ABC-2 type transport system permease protein